MTGRNGFLNQFAGISILLALLAVGSGCTYIKTSADVHAALPGTEAVPEVVHPKGELSAEEAVKAVEAILGRAAALEKRNRSEEAAKEYEAALHLLNGDKL